MDVPLSYGKFPKSRCHFMCQALQSQRQSPEVCLIAGVKASTIVLDHMCNFRR